MKTCRGCLLEKSLDEFHKTASICKPCAAIRRKANYQANKAHQLANNKRWRENNRDKRRATELSRYGIAPEDYLNMRIEQSFSCAICKRHESLAPRSNLKSSTETAMHVDHCHNTGFVRGLLCFNCNALLGKARDDVTVLEAAIKYLQTAQERAADKEKKDECKRIVSDSNSDKPTRTNRTKPAGKTTRRSSRRSSS